MRFSLSPLPLPPQPLGDTMDKLPRVAGLLLARPPLRLPTVALCGCALRAPLQAGPKRRPSVGCEGAAPGRTELTRVQRHGGAERRKRRRRLGLTRAAERCEAARGAGRGGSEVVAAAPVRQASFKPATGDDAAARCSPWDPLRGEVGGAARSRGGAWGGGRREEGGQVEEGTGDRGGQGG